MPIAKAAKITVWRASSETKCRADFFDAGPPIMIAASCYAAEMAWVKVPPEHHPIFLAALPKDERVQTMKMFGGIAAKVNGHVFSGLFGISTILWLPEKDRPAALALKGAAYFDPMGNGKMQSDKIMLPARFMKDPPELRKWIAKAFKAAALLEAKPEKAKPKKAAPKKAER